MRSKNSIINVSIAMISNVLNIIIGLGFQAVFIKILGNEYLGINGLFTNILSVLGIVELGIGSAIIYNLYKPVADENIALVKSLIKFYKKCYNIIIIVMVLIGLSMLPFLNSIVGKVNIKENIYLIFILFLIDIIISYFLAYKRSILYANQKEYITNLVHITYLIIMNLTQIVILIITKNFLILLTLKILFRILENLIISYMANKLYPYIKDKNIDPLGEGIQKDIIKKVKALFFHKMAGFVVLGSNNIIISRFLGGVVTVGLYSNYNLIISTVSTFFSQIFISVTASVGNLLVKENSNKTYEVYKKLLFLNFWLFTFASTSIFCIMDPFIKIWIGQAYILPKLVLISLVINFYFQGMRKTIMSFKEAAGIFYEDRFMPVIESITNIIASLILLRYFGLAGVFFGTVISTLFLFIYSYPKYVYKPIFKQNYTQYFKEMVFYLFLALISILITYLTTTQIKVENDFIKLVLYATCCLIIPNLMLFIILRKTVEFKYYANFIRNIIIKLVSKFNKKALT